MALGQGKKKDIPDVVDENGNVWEQDEDDLMDSPANAGPPMKFDRLMQEEDGKLWVTDNPVAPDPKE